MSYHNNKQINKKVLRSYVAVGLYKVLSRVGSCYSDW